MGMVASTVTVTVDSGPTGIAVISRSLDPSTVASVIAPAAPLTVIELLSISSPAGIVSVSETLRGSPIEPAGSALVISKVYVTVSPGAARPCEMDLVNAG